MGAHQVRAALDLPTAQVGHGRLQPRGGGGHVPQALLVLHPGLRPGDGIGPALVGQETGAVGQCGLAGGVGGPLADGGVGALQPGAQARDDVDPCGDQAGGAGGELGVPDLQGGEHGAGGAPRGAVGAGGLQQAGALGEDLLVLGARGGQGGAQRHGEVVQEATAPTRFPGHEDQVLGGEDDRAQHPEQVARTARPPVEAGPVGLARDDLDLNDAGALATDHLGAHDGAAGLLLTGPGPSDQGGLGADAVAGERGEVADRLHQVGLALAVGPDQGRGPGLQAQDQVVVGPEVIQRQVRDVHPRVPGGVRPRSGWALGGTGRSDPPRRRRTPHR